MSLLAELAALAPQANDHPHGKATDKPAGPGKGSRRRQQSRLLLDRYLRDYGVEYTTKESPGRVIYRLQCPFDPSHGANGETGVMQSDNGLVTFECKHNSCTGRQWHDFRDATGPVKPEHLDGLDDQPRAEPDPADPDAEEIAAPPITFPLITSAEFDAARYLDRYLVNRILTQGEPMIIGGKFKSLKTLIAMDLAISLGSGESFLDEFEVPKPVNVAVLSGESGRATLQRAARQICRSKGIELGDCRVAWGFSLPQIARDDHLAALGDAILAHQADVLIIDPAYLCLLSGATQLQASNLFDTGPLLLRLTELGQRHNCTIILIHHCRKNSSTPWNAPELEELSMAGFAEWARQWLLLGRREAYDHGSGDHRLWLNVGGSAGHSGLYGVDVSEGPTSTPEARKWSVAVVKASEVIQTARADRRSEREERRRAEDDAGQKAVIAALSELERGEGMFPRKLRAKTGIGDGRLERLLEQLTEQQIIETCSALRSPTHSRQQPGAYRLTEDWWKDA